MSQEEPEPIAKSKTQAGDDLTDQKGTLKNIGGSESDHWNMALLKQAAGSIWTKHADGPEQRSLAHATHAALSGIAPKDELEGMIAAQLIAAHNAAMECFRRAMLDNQTFEGRRENLNQANKLARTFATLVDALNKHRGKGQQKVTVEHVHVHAGGQAMVGTVERPGGGDQSRVEEQPHAKQIAHAPEPTLRGADAERDNVPIPRDGERPLPDARRQVSGRADRE